MGISIGSTAAYAQAELTPEDANKAASDDDVIGWNPYVNLTGTVSLSDNQSVIGQVNGFGALFGLGVVAGADYVHAAHLFRTSLSLNEGWARTPTISKFIKTNDNAKLDGQYNYFITKFFGAYGRLSLATSVFQTEDVKPASATWVDTSDLSNTEILKSHSDDFKLAGAFSPFTINESAGIFADPIRQGYFALSVRAGVGGRHTFANGDYVENGTQDATCANAGGPVDAGVPCVDLLRLSDVQQFGAELFAGANGKFDSNRATYKAGAAVLFPFVNNDSYHRSAAHLTRVAFEGQLAYTLSSWLSVVYNLQVIRDPELFPQGQEQVQVQNTVLLTFQYGLVKKKTKPKTPTKEQIELDAAKKRADAAEQKVKADEQEIQQLKQQQTPPTTPPTDPGTPATGSGSGTPASGSGTPVSGSGTPVTP